MTEAYIYDTIRTPRGKGKAEGSLNEISPVKLASQTLNALKKRNNLNTALVPTVLESRH